MCFSESEIRTGYGADKQVVQDLLDTLKANEDGCVGMAANKIGVNKKYSVSMGFANIAMINPVIVKQSDRMKQRKAAFR